MKIKLLKLINNERINKKMVSAKACESDATATDICEREDYADCTVNAYDNCIKDYAGCTEEANDICAYRDYAACFGAGEEDICNAYRDMDAN